MRHHQQITQIYDRTIPKSHAPCGKVGSTSRATRPSSPTSVGTAPKPMGCGCNAQCWCRFGADLTWRRDLDRRRGADLPVAAMHRRQTGRFEHRPAPQRNCRDGHGVSDLMLGVNFPAPQEITMRAKIMLALTLAVLAFTSSAC